MKYVLQALVVGTLLATSAAHASCRLQAKGEGIGQIEDRVDVPCDEHTARVGRGPTYHGITGFNITMVCANDRIPNGTWVYLKEDCQDASDDEIEAYENRGDR